jgi:hypothetical protein
MGEWKYSSTHSYAWHRMEVSGLIYTAATLPSGERAPAASYSE